MLRIVRLPVIPWPAGESFSMNNNREAYFEIGLFSGKLLHSYSTWRAQPKAVLFITWKEQMDSKKSL